MAYSLIVKCLAVTMVITLTSAQMPIPKRMVGYVYNQVSSDAPIHLDIHMGPLCPDSAEAHPNAKAVAVHYGSKLRLTLHMFPLPYHHQAYLTGIGAHVVDHVTSKKMTYDWFAAIYAGLDELSNDATANMTEPEVIGLLASFAEKCCNISLDAFESQMAIKDYESETRTDWKYSCSRGVSGTPTYFLNDVPIAAEQTWTLEDWKKVIDPLLAGTHARTKTVCPKGTTKCDYLPGKFECCTKGEGCIPNVGCRC